MIARKAEEREATRGLWAMSSLGRRAPRMCTTGRGAPELVVRTHAIEVEVNVGSAVIVSYSS